MSVNPRQICKLPTIQIEKGKPANLTIFAPNEEWVVNKAILQSKSKNTPFDKYKLKGKPKFTINNNQVTKCVL
jgi:dihydroorotase